MTEDAEQRWYDELTERLLSATHLTTWDLLLRAEERWPDNLAVISDEGSLTYRDLVVRALRCAAALRALGVGAGTAVASLMPGTLDWAVLHYGLARLGAVNLPVNLSYSRREIAAVLDNARPSLVVAVDSFREAQPLAQLQALDRDFHDGATSVGGFPSVRQVRVLRGEPKSPGDRLADPAHAAVFGTADGPALARRAEVRPDDAAYIVYTSGSTATPKGALVAHRGLSGAGTACAHALQVGPDDRFILMFPAFHVTGPAYLAATASVGAALYLIGVFDPARVLDAIEHGRCTVTFCLPTHFTKIMADPTFPERDVSSLRRVGLGGSRGFWEKLHEAFQLDSIVTCYGSTELSSKGALTAPARLPASHGRPLPGLEFRIVDPDTGAPLPAGQPGEVCFRGWARFIGYLPRDGADQDDGIDEQGFFHSGDFGHLDEDGHLHYRGRYKMMVKTGGENVAELEVETFLEEHLDDVEVAQVVGAPDPTWGEAVVAFVQLRDPRARPTTAELRDRCRDGLARFKIPKLFIVVRPEEWPLLPNNKIDKSVLRACALQTYQPTHG